MQSKVIACLFGLAWAGVCYKAGKVSQQQKNQTFTTEKVQIQHPQPKGAFIHQQSQSVSSQERPVKNTIQQNPFTNGLIVPPFRTVSYPNFKILYSTFHKCPLAVFEHVTKQIAHGDAPRRATFFNQPSIQPEFQSTNDHFIKPGAYKNFYLARGHMAAAGNYSGNKQAKFQTFTYANVIPQNQHNNGGIWNTFERYTRDLVMSGKCQSVDIISGPIYNKKQPYINKQTGELEANDKVFKQQSLVLLENGIVVPQKLYKIIQCNLENNTKHYIDGFEFWNKKTFDNEKPLKQFRTSLSSIEKQTGIKFGFGQKDPLTGKLKLPQSLVQFDKQGFQKTKKVYDQNFYLKLMLWSKTINEMNGSFYRAKQQHIFIPLEQLSGRSDQLFKKDMAQIKQNYKKGKGKVACQTLNKLIKLNKDLIHLNQLKSHHQNEIKEVEDSGVIVECLNKAHFLRGKSWEDLSIEEQRGDKEIKREKVSLNSLTHAVTKQELKIDKLKTSAEQRGGVKEFVNASELRKFIIPVNIETGLHQQAKI